MSLQRRTPLRANTPLKRTDGFMRNGRRYLTLECADCGGEFERRADQATGRPYCRSCVHKRAERRVDAVCAHCGSAFRAKAGEVARGKGKFCSRACSYAVSRVPEEARRRNAVDMSRRRKGAGNPAWKGLDTPGSVYREFSIRHKPEPHCRNCGRNEGLLHLHHIVPRSMCKAAIRDLRNGVPLCPACHLGWHRRRVVIYRDIFTAEEWAYVSSLSLLGQNVQAWLDDRYPDRYMPEKAAA